MEALLTVAFLTGLVGSTHCAGMCGGIVAGMAWQPRSPPSAVIPIHSVAVSPGLLRQLSFNIGRATTYAVLGGLAGSVSGAGLALGGAFPLREALFIAAQIMTILLGVHLSGILQPLAALERAGARLWKKVQPLAAQVLPADTPNRAFLLGLAWGFLPCGMVYSMLFTAMTAGSAASGGLVMLAFAAGTLPMLLALGAMAEQGKALLRQRHLRVAAGCVVIALGVAGLARAPGQSSMAALAGLCHTAFSP